MLGTQPMRPGSEQAVAARFVPGVCRQRSLHVRSRSQKVKGCFICQQTLQHRWVHGSLESCRLQQAGLKQLSGCQVFDTGNTSMNISLCHQTQPTRGYLGSSVMLALTESSWAGQGQCDIQLYGLWWRMPSSLSHYSVGKRLSWVCHVLINTSVAPIRVNEFQLTV